MIPEPAPTHKEWHVAVDADGAASTDADLSKVMRVEMSFDVVTTIRDGIAG